MRLPPTLGYAAFIRAINVPGHATVRMSDARDIFAAAGCQKVRTCIQSGNIIFESRTRDTAIILRKVRGKLRTVLGEEPDVFLRTVRELERIVNSAPFTDVGAEPGVKLYVAFLSRKPQRTPRFPLVSSKEALEAIAMSGREVFIVSRRKKSGFFGFPNNFIEQELGVTATSRNWSTITKIVELVRRG